VTDGGIDLADAGFAAGADAHRDPTDRFPHVGAKLPNRVDELDLVQGLIQVVSQRMV
jgi:hypothetical protein